MRSIDELLKNLGVELSTVIPLLLLVAFWWIFSILTSKVKKMSNNSEEAEKPGLQEQFLKVAIGGQSPDERLRPEPARAGVNNAYKSEDVHYPGSQIYDGQTISKPIHPRWWAA